MQPIPNRIIKVYVRAVTMERQLMYRFVFLRLLNVITANKNNNTSKVLLKIFIIY